MLRSPLRILLATTILACFVLGSADARRTSYGGTIVVGLSNGDPGSLDPTTNRSTALTEILRVMCLTLYDVESNHGAPQLVPVLAAALPAISADKLSYTVQLKREILFNDGTPFNAQAVVATYE